MAGRQPVLSSEVAGGRRREPLADPESLAVGQERGVLVSQGGRSVVAVEHLAQPVVRGGEILFERGVARSVRPEGVEHLGGPPQQQLAGPGGAREIGDRIVQLEDQAVGQPLGVPRTVRRLGAIPLGDARLAERGREAADQAEDDQGDRRHRSAVASHELPRSVEERVLPREHRPSVEVALHVLGQLVDRAVAPLRLLPQGLEDDGVEVARESASEPIRVGAGADGGARSRRLFVANDPRDLLRAARVELVGPPLGEELVEEDAEGIDVRRRRHRAARNLLGARVLRSHEGHARPRQLGSARFVRSQQLGDAEVEELRSAVARHEDVGRLEIPMHHQVAVSVGDGPADGTEEIEAAPQVESSSGAVEVQGQALHVLHREVGVPVLGRASVDQAGDRGMLESGQDAAFPTETLDEERRPGPSAEQLERHLLEVHVVVPPRTVHGAHATTPDLGRDGVGADPPPDEVGALCRRPLAHRRLQEAARGLVGPQQRLDVPPELEVVSTGLRHEGGAQLGRPLDRLVEDPLQLLPARGRHATPPSSRNSQALAIVHARFTVAGDSPRRAAVSSTDKPPK